jgi:hypothetical protein
MDRKTPRREEAKALLLRTRTRSWGKQFRDRSRGKNCDESFCDFDFCEFSNFEISILAILLFALRRDRPARPLGTPPYTPPYAPPLR